MKTNYKVGDLTVNTISHEIKRGKTEITLSKKEFFILIELIENENAVLERRQLFKAMYKDSKKEVKYDNKTNMVDVYISYLRRKIDKGQKIKLIHTVRDFGYKIQDKTKK